MTSDLSFDDAFKKVLEEKVGKRPPQGDVNRVLYDRKWRPIFRTFEVAITEDRTGAYSERLEKSDLHSQLIEEYVEVEIRPKAEPVAHKLPSGKKSRVHGPMKKRVWAGYKEDVELRVRIPSCERCLEANVICRQQLSRKAKNGISVTCALCHYAHKPCLSSGLDSLARPAKRRKPNPSGAKRDKVGSAPEPLARSGGRHLPNSELSGKSYHRQRQLFQDDLEQKEYDIYTSFTDDILTAPELLVKYEDKPYQMLRDAYFSAHVLLTTLHYAREQGEAVESMIDRVGKLLKGFTSKLEAFQRAGYPPCV